MQQYPSERSNSARPHSWVGETQSLAGGSLLVFAFAPFKMSLLAIVSVGLLFAAIQDCGWQRALLRGWLHGLAAFGGGMYWVFHSFAFVQIETLIALPLTILLVMVLASYSALMAGLYAWLAPLHPPLALFGLAPALWVVIEWLRGQSPFGITWLQLGYSQLDTPLAGWLPVFGSYGASFAVALTASLVAAMVCKRSLSYGMYAVVAAVWFSGAVLLTVSWTYTVDKPLHVALLQGNIPQHEKWLPDKKQDSIDRYLMLSKPHWGADLIVWPEVAVPDYIHRSQVLIDRLILIAKYYQSSVLLGLLVSTDDRRVFNSMYLIGASSGFYHKHHLVPFGEYLPFKWLLGPVVEWLGIRVSDIASGPPPESVPRLTLGKATLNVSICYEIIFGAAIAHAAHDTQLLVTASNDAWFGNSIGPHQHLQMARARALETGRWLARATNTGITAFVDSKGKIVDQAPQRQPTSLRQAVELRSGITPYMRWLDWPIVLLAVMVIMIAALMKYFPFWHFRQKHANTERP